MVQESQTIAAISTAVTEAGIGIVRMSGPDAFEIADCIYRGKNGKKLAQQKTHTIHYGFIEQAGETIDEVLVMLMRGPPHLYRGRHGRDQLPRRGLCPEEGAGCMPETRRPSGAARRVYQAGFPQRKDGSKPGGGCDRCHTVPE